MQKLLKKSSSILNFNCSSIRRKITSEKSIFLLRNSEKLVIFARAIRKTPDSPGEMAEWSNAAVLKTVEGHTSGGSNPSFSADFKCFPKGKHFYSKEGSNEVWKPGLK